MAKTVRVGCMVYVEEEVEVDDRFADIVQQLEEAEQDDDGDKWDDLTDLEEFEDLIDSIRWSYDNVIRISLNTEEESYLYEA